MIVYPNLHQQAFEKRLFPTVDSLVRKDILLSGGFPFDINYHWYVHTLGKQSGKTYVDIVRLSDGLKLRNLPTTLAPFPHVLVVRQISSRRASEPGVRLWEPPDHHPIHTFDDSMIHLWVDRP